jgi:acyl-CoA synthetase (AMP-forming)/AMP-acid ligase II
VSSQATEPRPTIPALLARSAGMVGSDLYLVTADDRLTYAEARRRSADIARRLLCLRVGKGARVGLFFPNGVEWVLWWLAICRIGAVAVPLSTLYAPAEIRTVLRLSDIELLIAPDSVLGTDTAEIFEAALPGLASATGPLQLPEAPYLREIFVVGRARPGWATAWDAGLPAVAPEILDAVENEVWPADPAMIIHRRAGGARAAGRGGGTSEPRRPGGDDPHLGFHG